MALQGVEHIGRRDLIWSYTATVFTIGAGILLYPFILVKLPSETVGVWNIFQIITSLVALLDFGFQPSFARNVSYVFSGAQGLKKEGMTAITDNQTIDYHLLNDTIHAMRVFYRRLALIVFLSLASIGTAYILYVTQSYSGKQSEIVIAWVLLIIINSFDLYTYYYGALLMGKGKVRQTQQINIAGQTAYILLAILFIFLGWGLVAIVASQLISIIIRRVYSYIVFFTPEIREAMQSVTQSDSHSHQEIFKAIMPNALKLGLTSIAGFLIYKMSVLIGGAILPLAVMGSYGLTFQVTDIIARMGSVYYQSFVPKIAQYRLENDLVKLRQIYTRSVIALFGVFIVLGGGVLLAGDWILGLLNSQTMFLPTAMFAVLLLIHLLGRNHVIAWGFILAKNEVPFMIPSLITAVATIILTYILLVPFQMGIWGLIIAPGITQIVYQNWKWPSVTIRELWQNRKTC